MSAVIVGLVALAGWFLDVGSLKSVLPDRASMKANAAICFVLAGAALWFSSHERPTRTVRIMVQSCAGIVALMALLTLAEYAFGRSSGIDQLLFREPAGALGTSNPGRMAASGAVSFLLLASALALFGVETRWSYLVAQLLGLGTALVGWAAFLGYSYGVSALYGPGPSTQMPLNTALTLVVLGSGVLFAHPDRGVAGIVTSSGAGGVVARRLLPVALGAPCALGWLVLKGQEQGFYSARFGLSLLVALVTVFFLTAIWSNASRLERVEEERVQLLAREREARAEIEVAEMTLATVIEQVPVGVVQTDVEGRIVFMNEAGRRITGGPLTSSLPERTIRHSVRDGMTGRVLLPQEVPIARALAGESVEGQECLLHRSDEITDVRIRTSAVPLHDANGQIVGAVAVFSDVTAERELERQKDDFLSSAAHDLKAPLTTLKGVAQLLQWRAMDGKTPESEQLRKGLDRIDMTATRMGRLIDDLLDVTRIQMGRPLDLLCDKTDLVDLARQVVAEQEAASRRCIGFEADVPEIAGRWDAERLQRVFTNLVSNAVKYSVDGGDIMVSVTTEETDGIGWAVLAVRDHGIGIPSDDLPHIFDRFFRGMNVAGQIPGTGIGLAGARQIVEQHGGSIEVESREGEGSVFRVRLPLA